MNTYAAACALAALDEIRGLLQAAHFAAQKFEQQLMTQEPLESLCGHIHSRKNGHGHVACSHPAFCTEPSLDSFRIVAGSAA